MEFQLGFFYFLKRKLKKGKLTIGDVGLCGDQQVVLLCHTFYYGFI